MSDLPRLNSPRSHTMPMNAALDVRQRLQELRTWQAEWQHDEALLGKRLDQLDETSPFYAQQAMQIASLRRRLSMEAGQNLRLIFRPKSSSKRAMDSCGSTWRSSSRLCRERNAYCG